MGSTDVMLYANSRVKRTYTKGVKVSDERKTCTVPEAGRMLGIGRAASYEAAHRGEIPTLRIGRKIVVPLAALNRLLSGDRK
jgi:excisionase family DNA binding protein